MWRFHQKELEYFLSSPVKIDLLVTNGLNNYGLAINKWTPHCVVDTRSLYCVWRVSFILYCLILIGIRSPRQQQGALIKVDKAGCNYIHLFLLYIYTFTLIYLLQKESSSQISTIYHRENMTCCGFKYIVFGSGS